MIPDDAIPDVDLEHVEPELARAWEMIAAAMHSAGHPMRITEGRRSSSRQSWLYAQGRTRPGAVVTHARPGESNHEPNARGLGEALDCRFTGPEPWAESHPWELYGETAEALQLEWGGRWARPDRPHIQLVRRAPAGVDSSA